MTYTLTAAAIFLAGGLLAVGLVLHRVFLVTTVDGSSMEPTLRSGDRLLVRRTRTPRVGQVVVFRYPDFLKAKAPPDKRSGLYLIKRAVAVPGDQLPPGWGWPDLRHISGQTVPPGSYVVLGDNREASFDSRIEGYITRARLVVVMIRHMTSPASPPGIPVSSAPASSSGSIVSSPLWTKMRDNEVCLTFRFMWSSLRPARPLSQVLCRK